MTVKYCAGCGHPLEEGIKFCPRCGSPAETAVPAAPQPPVGEGGYAGTQPGYQPPVYPCPPVQKPELTDADVKGTKYEPVSVWQFVGITFLCCIPLVGLIFLIVWACGGSKKVNLKNYAIATLICAAISVVISVLLVILMMVLFSTAEVFDHSYYDYGSYLIGLIR